MPEVHNQNHTKLFQTACEAPVNAPKEAFNLHDWVFTWSDKDYQATARRHIGAESSIHTDGTQTSVNVESVGRGLLVQHYVAEVKEPDHVKMVVMAARCTADLGF